MKRTAVLCLLISICLIGCGSTRTVDTDDYTPQQFSVDGSTARSQTIWQIENEEAEAEEEETEDYVVVDPSLNVGELVLTGEDTTQKWEIDGNNIVYNGITFNNLYYCIQHVDLPCDETNFINFIVKTFTSTSDVNTGYLNDLEDHGEDSTYIDLEPQLQESSEYLRIKEEHNNIPITWNISLHGDGINGNIYGCSSYLLYNGSDGTQEVDMSKYNYSFDTDDTTNTTEETSVEESNITETEEETTDIEEDTPDDEN
jgi:hypothetical protein